MRMFLYRECLGSSLDSLGFQIKKPDHCRNLCLNTKSSVIMFSVTLDLSTRQELRDALQNCHTYGE